MMLHFVQPFVPQHSSWRLKKASNAAYSCSCQTPFRLIERPALHRRALASASFFGRLPHRNSGSKFSHCDRSSSHPVFEIVCRRRGGFRKDEWIDWLFENPSSRRTRANSFIEDLLDRDVKISGFRVKLSSLAIPLSAAAVLLLGLVASSVVLTLIAAVLPFILFSFGFALFSVFGVGFAVAAVLFFIQTAGSIVFLPLVLGSALHAAASLLPIAAAIGVGVYLYRRALLVRQRELDDAKSKQMSAFEAVRRAEQTSKEDMAAWDARLRRSKGDNTPPTTSLYTDSPFSSSGTSFSRYGSPSIYRSVAGPVEAPGLSRDPREWTASDVADWLHVIGMGAYGGKFISHGIDGLALKTLTNEDLRDELGVLSLGDRKRVLSEIGSIF